MAPANPPANPPANTPTNPPANPPAGDDAKTKGRRPGPAKEYDFSGLDLDLLANPQEVSVEMASQFAPSRARDAKQVAVDKVVSDTYDAWLAAGSPSKWSQMPKQRYHVPPAAEEGMRYLIRRAADFHGYAIKWGGQEGTKVKDKDGRIVLVFAVRSRRVRDTADASPEPEDDDDE